jgi:hypothetical protein
MTGWAVNSMAKAIEGSIPFLPSCDFINPNAGIGRQDNLKIYWYLSWTFKSFFGYICIYIDPFVQWLRQNSFIVEIGVQIPYGLLVIIYFLLFNK